MEKRVTEDFGRWSAIKVKLRL